MNRQGLFHAAWLQHSGMFPTTAHLPTLTLPWELLYRCQVRGRELTLTEEVLTTAFTDTEFHWKLSLVSCLRGPVVMSNVEELLHLFSFFHFGTARMTEPY